MNSNNSVGTLPSNSSKILFKESVPITQITAINQSLSQSKLTGTLSIPKKSVTVDAAVEMSNENEQKTSTKYNSLKQ